MIEALDSTLQQHTIGLASKTTATSLALAGRDRHAAAYYCCHETTTPRNTPWRRLAFSLCCAAESYADRQGIWYRPIRSPSRAARFARQAVDSQLWLCLRTLLTPHASFAQTTGLRVYERHKQVLAKAKLPALHQSSIPCGC